MTLVGNSGMYFIRDGVAELGIGPGAWLHIKSDDPIPYLVTREVSKAVAEIILSHPGVEPGPKEKPPLRLLS